VVSLAKLPRAAMSSWKNALSSGEIWSLKEGRIPWQQYSWRNKSPKFSPLEAACLQIAWTSVRFMMSLAISGLRLQILTLEETSTQLWRLKISIFTLLLGSMVDSEQIWSRSLTSRNDYIGRHSTLRSRRTPTGSVLKAVVSFKFRLIIWLSLEASPQAIKRQTIVTCSMCTPTKLSNLTARQGHNLTSINDSLRKEQMVSFTALRQILLTFTSLTWNRLNGTLSIGNILDGEKDLDNWRNK